MCKKAACPPNEFIVAKREIVDFIYKKNSSSPDYGGVLCCDGRKVACNWAWKQDLLYPQQEAEDIFQKCITKHEQDHFDDIGDCPCTQGITRLPFKKGVDKKNRNSLGVELAGGQMVCKK